ncbi:MAG: DUF397 domain-containing protein [Actinophytocola sp.]|uniref:DUF397 domain-containing protein n=1 Tax=Actinophytocola sp. TaxID=1872138 RepID=UPI003D6A8C9D
MDLVGARWRKSTFSGGGGDENCVEVALVDSVTAVRDSKNATGPVLVLPRVNWHVLPAAPSLTRQTAFPACR